MGLDMPDRIAQWGECLTPELTGNDSLVRAASRARCLFTTEMARGRWQWPRLEAGDVSEHGWLTSYTYRHL